MGKHSSVLSTDMSARAAPTKDASIGTSSPVDVISHHHPFYMNSRSEISRLLHEHYSVDATFVDPLGRALNRQEGLSFLQTVPAFFSQTRVEVSLVSAGRDAAGRVVVLVDSVHHATPKFLPRWLSLKYRAFTKYTFNRDGLIVAHEEAWSVAEWLSFLPLGLGCVYDCVLRRGFARFLHNPLVRGAVQACCE